MPDGRLYLGNRRYSSWSMRGWLAVSLARLDVEEVVIPLSGGGDTGAVRQVSPSGLVPYLEHNGHRVWETLAICEYCAELSPAIWPADFAARTRARVIATEMHAGFRDLRMAMPMNLGRVFAGLGRSEGALADIERIETLWAETRQQFGRGGPFLFGASIQRRGRDVRARGRPVSHLPARADWGNAGLLRGGSCAPARRGLVRRGGGRARFLAAR